LLYSFSEIVIISKYSQMMFKYIDINYPR